MKRGNVDAAFLLGTLAPDGKNSTQHDIASSKLERRKTVAETLPHNVEIWQAYFSNLLEINGKDRALTAINEAVAKYPANKSMQLLRLRLEIARVSIPKPRALRGVLLGQARRQLPRIYASGIAFSR